MPWVEVQFWGEVFREDLALKEGEDEQQEEEPDDRNIFTWAEVL